MRWWEVEAELLLVQHRLLLLLLLGRHPEHVSEREEWIEHEWMDIGGGRTSCCGC